MQLCLLYRDKITDLRKREEAATIDHNHWTPSAKARIEVSPGSLKSRLKATALGWSDAHGIHFLG